MAPRLGGPYKVSFWIRTRSRTAIIGRMIMLLVPHRDQAMTADQLITEAAENRPADPPPSLDDVERGLRRLLESMLSAFDYGAQFSSGAALACRGHALLIAEVQALRRMHAN